MALRIVQDFLKLEAASGIVLFVAALVALIVSNSPFVDAYYSILQTPIAFKQPVIAWINDGFMTIFFLLVALELKRECVIGELANFKSVVLPGIAALGGMVVPAVLYVAINFSYPETLKGWPVPVATDIAFALGVVSLLGKRVPLGLKLFLTALAIFDDVGAIIIIAFFQTKAVSYYFLLLAAAIIFGLWLLNRFRVARLLPYLLLGTLLWFCILKSGVHATVAGVLTAFFVPARHEKQPLQKLEDILHPWVAYLILPVFALANAGISFHGLSCQIVFDPITLGIIVGLFVGKQLGVFCFARALIKLGWAQLPINTSWLELYGVAVLCGIGFTMSLFLGTLAFNLDQPISLVKVRLGVLVGSVLSGVTGWMILRIAVAIKNKGLEP